MKFYYVAFLLMKSFFLDPHLFMLYWLWGKTWTEELRCFFYYRANQAIAYNVCRLAVSRQILNTFPAGPHEVPRIPKL